MKRITLNLSLEEANKILAALGQLPYVQVHELIQSLHLQAQQQLEGGKAENKVKEAAASALVEVAS